MTSKAKRFILMELVLITSFIVSYTACHYIKSAVGNYFDNRPITITEISKLNSALDSKEFANSVTKQYDLKQELERKGIKEKDIRTVMNHFANLNSEQLKTVESLLKANNLNIYQIATLCSDLKMAKSQLELISIDIDRHADSSTILNNIINVKGELERLNKYYGFDIKELKSNLLNAEKEWKKETQLQKRKV